MVLVLGPGLFLLTYWSLGSSNLLLLLLMTEFYAFLMAEHYFMMYVFFMHLSVDGHLGYFHFLAIMNSASVSTHGSQMCVLHTDFISFDYIYPVVGLLDHMEALFLMFWGTFILFSIMAVLTSSLTSTVQKVPSLHILPSM